MCNVHLFMFPPQIFQLTSGPLESQAAETVTKLRAGPGPAQLYHDSCVDTAAQPPIIGISASITVTVNLRIGVLISR